MFFKILVFATVWAAIYCDCHFFEHEMSHGEFLYENVDDRNLTLAPNNYILRFSCSKGYKLTEPQFIYCREDEWSDELPRCTMLNCPKPPSLEHGHIEIQKGTVDNPIVGSKAVYTCAAGYELRNLSESTLSCVLEDNTAIWEGSLSNCTEKKNCPDPGVSDHGIRKGPCCYTGALVTYSCKRNYKLVGDHSIFCLLGGNWSAPRPKCRPPRGICPDPPIIENGVVQISAGVKVGDYYLSGDEVEVVCDSGYAFYGETEYVFCEDNLEWDAEFGECRETFCPRPNMPANGSIAELEHNNSTEFSQGFGLTYFCDDGFRFFIDNVRSCNKGKWSGKEPICEKIRCYDPSIPENGMRNGDDFGVGSRVTFSCFSGFDLIGSIERYCLSNGQWSGELARCNLQANYCPNPGVPINGKRTGDEFNEGDRVNFSCQAGFRLIGSNVSVCLPDRTWSGDEAFCLGAFDFDNENDVSNVLKLSMEEKAEKQAVETEKFEITLDAMRRKPVRARKIDLNFPGRYILYFLFDVSGSVKERNFNASIKFAQALVKKVGVSKNGARVGALTFSSKSTIQFLPMNYLTTNDVLEALGKIKYEKGGTATSSALQIVREEMIPIAREHLGYINVKSVIFLLTDGRANTGGSPKIQGDLLKKAGAEIYCIGITGDIKKNELYELASVPLDEHVFVLKDYLMLDWLVQEITNGTIDFSQCGLAAKRRQKPKIIDGEEVIEPWPWMAALYFKPPGAKNNRPSKLKCGGSIINREWILTAAHCLVKNGQVLPTSDVTIKLGLTHVDNSTLLQEFEAEQFYVHPEYEDDETFDHDIALIKLGRLIEYNRYVRPVCLPPKELPPTSKFYEAGQNAFATGWGYDGPLEIGQRDGSKSVDILKQLVLPLQERRACQQSILDHGLPAERFTKRMLCAGKGDGKEDTCVGDSGGPLMQSQVNKEEGTLYWTQIGIVSWGLGCGQVNTYGMYTHVHDLLPWIHSVVTENEV